MAKICILLVTYNRPNSFLRLVTSVTQAIQVQDFVLHVFCDGPKNHEDISAQDKIRTHIHSSKLVWERIVFRKDNLGLKTNIYNAVSETLSQYEKVIVLEDDLIISRGALEYFRTQLIRWQDDVRVCQIIGYLPSYVESKGRQFATTATSSWGWATWSRAWKGFQIDQRLDINILKNTQYRYKYDQGGAYPFSYITFLEAHGITSSWAIRWYYYNYTLGNLSIYPPYPFVYNSGLVGKRTHGLISLFRFLGTDPLMIEDNCVANNTFRQLSNLNDLSTCNYFKYYYYPRGYLHRLVTVLRWRTRFLVLLYYKVRQLP